MLDDLLLEGRMTLIFFINCPLSYGYMSFIIACDEVIGATLVSPRGIAKVSEHFPRDT